MDGNGWVGAPYSEPDTSKAAAESILEDLGRLQAKVYSAIRRAGSYGRTTHELERELGLLMQTAVPRVWELRKMGLVIDSGLRRLTPSRRNAKVWRLAPPKQLELEL